MLYTIGYGNLPIESFSELLRSCSIDVVCDVRSSPYSRYSPDYSQRELKEHLNGGPRIKYAFFGNELGARPKDRNVYIGSRADYDLIAAASFFRAGLERIRRGSADNNIALMCAEKDPIECHRAILVCRNLPELTDQTFHIHHDGRVESQAELATRLVRELGMDPPPLLESEAAWSSAVNDAFREQSMRIAYTESPQGARLA